MKYLILFLLIMLFGLGCGTRQVRRDGVLVPFDEAAVLELKDLKAKHPDPTSTAYIADLNQFIQAYEDAPATHEARFLMAQALYKRNRLDESYRILNDIELTQFPQKDRSKVLYLLAMNAKENGMYLE